MRFLGIFRHFWWKPLTIYSVSGEGRDDYSILFAHVHQHHAKTFCYNTFHIFNFNLSLSWLYAFFLEYRTPEHTKNFSAHVVPRTFQNHIMCNLFLCNHIILYRVIFKWRCFHISTDRNIISDSDFFFSLTCKTTFSLTMHWNDFGGGEDMWGWRTESLRGLVYCVHNNIVCICAWRWSSHIIMYAVALDRIHV